MSDLSIPSSDPKAADSPVTPRVLENLTVVVPIADGDETWRTLLLDLTSLPVPAQILLVGTTSQPDDLDEFLNQSGLCCTIEWLCAARGRARQMNHGASYAAHEFLWFLHADSRLNQQGLEALARALDRDAHALHYFDLAFLPDGPRAVKLNAWAANLRSRVARLPFGDQGFCIPKQSFWRLGGFDESVPYGEDHHFIWKAHQVRVPLRCVGATIQTSARKYAQCGWSRTTLAHLWLTAKQAAPQAFRLLRSRLGLGGVDAHGRERGNVCEVRGRQSQHRPRLLVFTKCPDPGHCKTRLIPTLGAAGATAIHERLIDHTLRWANELGQSKRVDVQVHFAGDNIDRLRCACGSQPRTVIFRRQVEGNLGDRLSAAFANAFRDGSPKVVAVGTDCPRLGSELVALALELLDEADVVIGPAEDGGYYLIALRGDVPSLFNDIPWSSSAVLSRTLERACDAGLTAELLTVLKDVDRAEDLHELEVPRVTNGGIYSAPV